jgi:hypothetical protein
MADGVIAHLSRHFFCFISVTTVCSAFSCRHISDAGTTYWGGWLEGKRHGLGILTAAGSTATFGEWDGGEMLGRGVTLDSAPSSTHVEGRDDGAGAGPHRDTPPGPDGFIATAGSPKTKLGRGICTFENGDAFAGEWVAEMVSVDVAAESLRPPPEKKPEPQPGENRGSCVWEVDPGTAWATKSTVSFSGSGFYKYANGDYYAGEFRNMVREGRGTYVGVDGGKYAGSWKSGRYHGLGTLLLPGGRGIQTGRWADNQYVGDVGEHTVPYLQGM